VPVVSMSKKEFDRLEVLLGVQSGSLRVADACALLGLGQASSRLNDDGHMPCRAGPCRLDRHLDVLAENCEKFHQPSDRHRDRPATHQRGNLRLGCAEELGGFRLS
jgi:hypothetical protein